MEYRLIRSRRKTVGLQITAEGLTVRAPLFMSKREIEKFVAEHREWIETHTAKIERSIASAGAPLTDRELKEMAVNAKTVFSQRVAYYAPIVGVSYGRITIRAQHTRWGSCSSKGNLNFNCLLMLAPSETLDSVVVHELCHRKHMNHSKAFYAEVLRVFPEYRKWNSWLKTNGAGLMAKLPREDGNV